MNRKKAVKRSVEPRQNDEIAESVKATMRALGELFSPSGPPRQVTLRSVGSEFGHIVARNISRSNDPDIVLAEIATFWNGYALGEMSIAKDDPTSFTLRNCFDCIGVEPSNVLCGFKEGFVNAILNDRTGGIGSVEEVECCATGGKDCRFKVKTIHHEPHSEIPLPVLG